MRGENFGRSTPLTGVTAVEYRGAVAGVVGSTRFYLSPDLALLDESDPLVVFVSVMAAYALRVREGSAPGPYTEERAEQFARLVLMDDEEFRMLDANRLENRLIAGHFGVPVEQVEDKRRDLESTVHG